MKQYQVKLTAKSRDDMEEIYNIPSEPGLK